MVAIDPTISVGAVGIGGDQTEWGNFGNEVLRGTGPDLDFYVVHDYGFDSGPTIDDVLSRPERSWPVTMGGIELSMAETRPAREIPVAVTEYNMFAFADGDPDALMSKAVSAFYIADSIGQMARLGVSLANQWNVLNGASSAGSDYGLLDPETGAPMPQFYAMAIWSTFGAEMLPVGVGLRAAVGVRAYGGRDERGTITLLVLNRSGDDVTVPVVLADAAADYSVLADVVTASAMDAPSVSYNGVAGTDTHLADIPGTDLGLTTSETVRHLFPARLITRLTFTPTG